MLLLTRIHLGSNGEPAMTAIRYSPFGTATTGVYAATLALATWGGMAQAATLEQLSLDELVRQSTAVVRARVVKSEAALKGSDVFTIYALNIVERLKSEKGQAIHEVAVAGGVAGGYRQVVAGAPTLRTGVEYVLFLWRGPSGMVQLAGLSQGLLEVQNDPATGKVWVARGPSGEQMLAKNGRPVTDQAVRLEISALRERVGQVLAEGAFPKADGLKSDGLKSDVERKPVN